MRLHGDDKQLDNTLLMRMAGRFARRVRAFAAAHDVPVVDCGRGERKHRIAQDYLADHAVGPGVFLILIAGAPATVWKVSRAPAGVIRNLAMRKFRGKNLVAKGVAGLPGDVRDLGRLVGDGERWAAGQGQDRGGPRGCGGCPGRRRPHGCARARWRWAGRPATGRAGR